MVAIGAALPDPAVPGRRPDPPHAHRGADLGGRSSSSPSSSASTSLPAACAASRSCRPSSTGSSCVALLIPLCSCCGVAGTARVADVGRRARDRLGRAARRGPRDVPHLLPDPRDLPRHHGPAPRRGPLLHQPRRPRRSSYDAGGAGLLSVFYLLPTLYGVLGRLYASDLVGCGPHRLGGPRAAEPSASAGPRPSLLTALLAARAPSPRSCRRRRARRLGRRRPQPGRSPAHGVRAAASRLPARRTSSVALVLTLVGQGCRSRTLSSCAFAVAASTFCRCCSSGIWWRGLTATGAVAGMVAGGGLSRGRFSTMFGVATAAGRVST